MTVVVCGTLTNPVNGQVSHTAGTTFGQTATYSCGTCFNLVGDNTRTCQATGMWSGSAPTCQSKLLPSACTQVGSNTLLPNCPQVLVRRSNFLHMQNKCICTRHETRLIASSCGVLFFSCTNCITTHVLSKLSIRCQSCNDGYWHTAGVYVILNFS